MTGHLMPPRFARRTSRDSARSALSTASQETFATALASPPTSTPFVSPALSTPFATPFTPSLSPLPTAGYFDPDPQPQPQSQSEWVEFNPEDLKVGSPAGFEYTWLLHSETSSAYDPEDEVGFRCESSLSLDFIERPCVTSGVKCDEPECPSCRSSL